MKNIEKITNINLIIIGDRFTSHGVTSVMFLSKVSTVMTPGPKALNHVLIVIAKTEQLQQDMKFIGQMANVNLASSLGQF